MTPVATSTFLQVIFAMMILVPMVILWVAAAVDVFRHGYTGLKIAALLVLILIVPILGPILYFVFNRPSVDAEQAYLAEADRRHEASSRSVGGTGMYR